MEYKLFQLFIIINIIEISLFDGPEYDFGKHGTAITKDYCIIFDPTGFQVGETMFFKISATEFNDDFLYYEYLDDLENYEFNFNLKKLHEVKSYYKKEPDEDSKSSKAIHYFKIVKSKEDLGNLEGKYLLLYCNFDGTAEIVNTKKDEGKRSQILSIVISIVCVVAIALIAYFCFFRKKCKKDDEVNEINVVQYQNNNQQINENIQNNNKNMNNYNKNNQNMNFNINKPKNNVKNKNEYNDNNNNCPPSANYNNNYNRTNNIPDVQYTGNEAIEYNQNNNIYNIPNGQYTVNGGFEQNPNFNQYSTVPQNSVENRAGYTSNYN